MPSVFRTTESYLSLVILLAVEGDFTIPGVEPQSQRDEIPVVTSGCDSTLFGRKQSEYPPLERRNFRGPSNWYFPSTFFEIGWQNLSVCLPCRRIELRHVENSAKRNVGASSTKVRQFR